MRHSLQYVYKGDREGLFQLNRIIGASVICSKRAVGCEYLGGSYRPKELSWFTEHARNGLVSLFPCGICIRPIPELYEGHPV